MVPRVPGPSSHLPVPQRERLCERHCRRGAEAGVAASTRVTSPVLSQLLRSRFPHPKWPHLSPLWKRVHGAESQALTGERGGGAHEPRSDARGASCPPGAPGPRCHGRRRHRLLLPWNQRVMRSALGSSEERRPLEGLVALQPESPSGEMGARNSQPVSWSLWAAVTTMPQPEGFRDILTAPIPGAGRPEVRESSGQEGAAENLLPLFSVVQRGAPAPPPPVRAPTPKGAELWPQSLIQPPHPSPWGAGVKASAFEFWEETLSPEQPAHPW